MRVKIEELHEIDYERYDFEHFISDNGSQLLNDSSRERPKLTVELESEWHSLYLIRTHALNRVDFGWLDAMEDGPASVEPPFVDHVPNPRSVRKLAEDNGWKLDGLAEQLIEGRWKLKLEAMGVRNRSERTTEPPGRR